MKRLKKLSLVVLVLCSWFSFAQQDGWNHWSFDAGYGYVQPSSLFKTPQSSGKFAGFRHAEMGLRYMVTPTIGGRLSYNNDRFEYKRYGVEFNTFQLEAVYNVGSLFQLSYWTYETVGLLAHAGSGITIAGPESIKKYETIGTATLGLTPQVKVADRLSIYADLTYAFHFKQHYGFDGVLLDPDYNAEVGKSLRFAVGIQLYLGKERRHVDWY
jgi:OOP family OmpA-OmpF porin